MKEIPILFSTQMVPAILDGRKIMTRRVNGLDEINEDPNDWQFEWADYALKKPFRFTKKSTVNEQSLKDRSFYQAECKCPYGQPGDILWVRENFKMTGWDFEDSTAVIEFCTGESQEFETPDGDDEAYAWIVKQYEKLLSKDIIEPGEEEEGPMKFTGKNHPWSPSIHIPKWCSRIWLEVTDVRVERLQNINPNDACEEGVEYWNIDGDAMEGGELVADFKNYTWTEKKEDDPNYEDRYFPTFANPCDSFRTLWQSINGPESWEANPWVWVVSFKVLSTTGRPEFHPSLIASPGEGAVVALLPDEKFNSQQNQNRDKAIVGYKTLPKDSTDALMEQLRKSEIN